METAEKTEDKTEEKLPFEMVEVPGSNEPLAPRRSTPVMDVRRPQIAPTPTADASVHTPPPEPPKDQAAKPEAAPVPTPPTQAKTPEPSKTELRAGSSKVGKQEPARTKEPHQPGVALAIFTAAIVVLALAALATYAYLKTNNITVF